MGPVSGKPVNIEIVGPGRRTSSSGLRSRGDRDAEGSAVYARLEGLENDMARGRPELVVEVDRERAALYELSTSQVGMTIRTAIQGAEARSSGRARTSTTSSSGSRRCTATTSRRCAT
jgi:multidrug efflux pump